VVAGLAHVFDGMGVKIPSQADFIGPGDLNALFDQVVHQVEYNGVGHALSHGQPCDRTDRIHTGVQYTLAPDHGDDLVGVFRLESALGKGIGDA